jgi:hypothetical protein
MTTASSAARKGATAKAVIASAPIAAAQSERRLKGLGDIGFLSEIGGLKRSLERRRPIAIGWSARYPKIRAGAAIVTAGRTRLRENRAGTAVEHGETALYTTTLSRFAARVMPV